MASRKTDNANLGAKLDLRRYFLRKYHADGQPIRVFDCCQGSGVIWRQLRKEFDVTSYWGVDLKPKAGRLTVDSQRILVQPGMCENVIDIDTYGSPWKHWAALLPGLNRDATVFLTIGQWQMGTCSQIPKGIGLDGLHIPPGILSRLHGFATSYLLTIGCDFGIILSEAVEAVSAAGHARYIGVRLEKKAAATQVETAKPPKHRKSAKETCNV